MVTKLPCVTLGCLSKSTAHVDISDNIEHLQSIIAEQINFTSAESISSCVRSLHELADKAIRPRCDLWPKVIFYDKSKLYADLTKAYKNVRLASNVETSVEVSVLPETLDTLAHQGRQPA